MITGRVIDVYKRYVKVKTPLGEKVLKMKGRKVPPKGWILEMRKDDVPSQFAASVVLESLDPLPPLPEIVPLIENLGSSDPFDVTFLSNLTRALASRLGTLPSWYYKTLGEYYRKGEGEGRGVYSEIVSKVIGEKRSGPDRLKAFGDWLNTFSHPFYFRSKAGGKRPTRIFIRKPTSFVRIDHMSENHGRVIVEGTIGKVDAKLKVISEVPIDPRELEKLRKNLEKLLGNATVVQGGMGFGVYV